jgi:hypothetical protein
VIFDDPPGKGIDENAMALIVAWYRERQARRAEEADW